MSASPFLGSASALILLQLFSRLFTFILNQSLLAFVSPEAFGTVSVQFELVSGTILFLCREGIRGAALRSNGSAQSKVNISYMPFLAGMPMALIAAYVYSSTATRDTREQPGFSTALSAYTVAAVIELLCEPFHNVAMSSLRTNVRVRAEGLGVFCKTLTTFLLIYFDVSTPLIAFALGQLAYSLTLFHVYGIIFVSGSYFPLPTRERIDSSVLRISLNLTSQSFVKHILTEGDKFVLSYMTPLQDQGGYALAANYGSLIARIVLQPIEETLRIFFAATTDISKSASTLRSLLQTQLALSSLVIIFGRAYMPIVSSLLLPHRYQSTSAPRLLIGWVYYVPVLALNGGLEAFLASVSSPSDLNSQSKAMGVFSTLYISFCLLFYSTLKLGDISFIYANILNLLLRIAYATNFARAYFKSRGERIGLRDVIPRWDFLALCGLCAMLISMDEKRVELTSLRGVIEHVAVGGALGIVTLGYWFLTSGRHLLPSTQQTKSKIQ